MSILITLLIIVAVVAVAIWLIKQLVFPPGLTIIGAILIAIVIIIALPKVLALL